MNEMGVWHKEWERGVNKMRPLISNSLYYVLMRLAMRADRDYGDPYMATYPSFYSTMTRVAVNEIKLKEIGEKRRLEISKAMGFVSDLGYGRTAIEYENANYGHRCDLHFVKSPGDKLHLVVLERHESYVEDLVTICGKKVSNHWNRVEFGDDFSWGSTECFLCRQTRLRFMRKLLGPEEFSKKREIELVQERREAEFFVKAGQ